MKLPEVLGKQLDAGYCWLPSTEGTGCSRSYCASGKGTCAIGAQCWRMFLSRRMGYRGNPASCTSGQWRGCWCPTSLLNQSTRTGTQVPFLPQSLSGALYRQSVTLRQVVTEKRLKGPDLFLVKQAVQNEFGAERQYIDKRHILEE